MNQIKAAKSVSRRLTEPEEKSRLENCPLHWIQAVGEALRLTLTGF